MQTSSDAELDLAILTRLERLYGDRAQECLSRIVELASQFFERRPMATPRAWDETEVVLITYGDNIQEAGLKPLAALRRGLLDFEIDRLVSTVHLLPFFPYSSDDGFSVVDYRAVDPALGNWEDVAALGGDFRLAFDLVLNHVSSQSAWFAAYQRGDAPYDKFFVEVDPTADLSKVTRPRSLPLLTSVETSRGTRHVWTTFSADQIDLNFAEPAVLVAMLEVLLDYVARGAQIVRLDAIAFLWKEVGTSCLHLWQTHEVVKLMRDVLSAVAPHVWLLTETNVPHHENVSYFGESDEAQLVYQFSLPPLLLDAFTFGEAAPLQTWLTGLESPRPGTTFLNFTASHDGVGVRPLEGLVPDGRIGRLVDAMRERGGLVSSRPNEEGADVPYEINISYVDALAPADRDDTELHARRFLASQAIMLALRGIPAVYFHSLFGTSNATAAAVASGQPRRINRRKFRREELNDQIGDRESLAGKIHAGYLRLLEVRRRQAAFHPEAQQTAVDLGDDRVVGFVRRCDRTDQTLLVLANVGDSPVEVDVSRWFAAVTIVDLIDDRELGGSAGVVLSPGQARWLTPAGGVANDRVTKGG